MSFENIKNEENIDDNKNIENAEIFIDINEEDFNQENSAEILMSVGKKEIQEGNQDKEMLQKKHLEKLNKNFITTSDTKNDKTTLNLESEDSKIILKNFLGASVLIPYVVYFSVENSDEVVGIPGFIDLENKKFVDLNGKNIEEDGLQEKLRGFIEEYLKMILVHEKGK